jgi:hypothetical protein
VTLTHESSNIPKVESLPSSMTNLIVESASFSSLEICTLGHMKGLSIPLWKQKVFHQSACMKIWQLYASDSSCAFPSIPSPGVIMQLWRPKVPRIQGFLRLVQVRRSYGIIEEQDPCE